MTLLTEIEEFLKQKGFLMTSKDTARYRHFEHSAEHLKVHIEAPGPPLNFVIVYRCHWCNTQKIIKYYSRQTVRCQRCGHVMYRISEKI